MRRHGDTAVADRTAGDSRSGATMTQSHAQMVTGPDGTGKAAGRTVPIGRSSGAPPVVPLKAAELGELDDLPELGWLHWAMFGRVHLQ